MKYIVTASGYFFQTAETINIEALIAAGCEVFDSIDEMYECLEADFEYYRDETEGCEMTITGNRMIDMMGHVDEFKESIEDYMINFEL
ncbi:hypothetical protein ACX818_001402 [Acinetobacter baumannii]